MVAYQCLLSGKRSKRASAFGARSCGELRK